MEEASSAAWGLFGRDEALRTVNGVVNDGGTAVATGEPGVGKSSLLRVADQLAQRRGRRVLSVTPTQFDHGLPFAGLAELVAQCPHEVQEALPEPQRRALAVALQRLDPDGKDVDALAIPLAVRGLLTLLCDREPLALVIDDLQWLDQASVGSLGFALRRLQVDQHRLSVLIGMRPEGAGSDLLASLAEPRRDISLPPLPNWALGQLLRDRFGARWTPPMADGVARASGGNPFLALMIAQAMQSEFSRWRWSARDGHDPVFPVPPSLVEILGEKVSLLPHSAREVLLLVSAAGRLTVAQLEELVSVALVRSALEAAADWDVATVGAGSLVSFTHPMLASAIYDDATPAARRTAHRLLADRLEDPLERARHRARTLTGPSEAIATDLEQAADISRGRGAPQLAGELLEASARATPIEPTSAAGLARWLRSADAYIDAGDLAAAEVALDTGSALSVTPEQQAQVLSRRMRMTDDTSDYRDIAERAFRLAPRGSEVRAETLYVLGEVHRQQGRGMLARRLTEMAITEAAALQRADIQLAALTERLEIERIWAMGQPEETVGLVDQLHARLASDPTSDDFAWVWPWFQGFFASWNDESAERNVRSGIAAMIAAGRYGDLSHLYICLVVVLTRASRVTDAQAALEEADRLGAWAFSGIQEDMARVFVAEYTGDLDAARERAHLSVKKARSSGSTYWLSGFLTQLGFIETSARDWQAALEALREVAAIFERTGMVELEQLMWGVDYADASLQVGALDEVESAIGFLRRQGAAGRPEATVAADRCAALLTAARGDSDSALHDLVQIVDQRGDESPFEAARSRLALGQVYRRAGYKGLAAQTLLATADTFDSLGVPRWADRARDDAGRVGLNATTGTLTETERRIAELVASGHSNQETAAELFISVKTVEANLTRIYRKLSVRSRTELANHMTAADSASHDG